MHSGILVCAIVFKADSPLKEHQIVPNRRSWGASTNKSTLAVPGVKGTTPQMSAPSLPPQDPTASKHSTAAGVTPNLNSRLWLSPDQMSGAGEKLAGREKEMHDCRREMDGAVKRGQALIDPGGRDV